MSLTFGRPVRLRARAEFTVVQETGRRVATPYVTLLGLGNTLDRDRLGIIASRRLGGAVVRNRAKRRLRELFRQTEPDQAAARGARCMDVVAIPRRELIRATHTALQSVFQNALDRLRRGAR